MGSIRLLALENPVIPGTGRAEIVAVLLAAIFFAACRFHWRRVRMRTGPARESSQFAALCLAALATASLVAAVANFVKLVA